MTQPDRPEQKARAARAALNHAMTRDSFRELTDEELTDLRAALWHWYECVDSERQRRRAESR
jgi:hypothetical protein